MTSRVKVERFQNGPAPIPGPAAEYTNPVYGGSFPDPFVMRFRGIYYAYCTGFGPDGDVFGVLTSSDLVNWKSIGSAMERLPDDPPYYWAPEVTYDSGKFYLYYSVGNETLMHIRLAVSDDPAGGFRDTGCRLTFQDFAIDPHVFTDVDGTRYLFYATDFLEHDRIGTGTVVDRMLNWDKLAGEPKPVTRAAYEWQLYDANRKEKGGVRWYTVEGPAVLERKGRYYEMFSGGNWQNLSYGVSFAVSDRVLQDREWTQFADGEKVFPILQTIPGKVLGPGHNSVVRGPNGRELYCVYHSWNNDVRAMAIDRMDLTGERVFVEGPSYTARPAPFRPTFEDRFENIPANATGNWTLDDGAILADPSGTCEIAYSTEGSFLCEFCFRCTGSQRTFGFELLSGSIAIGEVYISDSGIAFCNTGGERFQVETPGRILDGTWHLMRFDVYGHYLNASIDGRTFLNDIPLPESPQVMRLFSRSAASAFSSLFITNGFEDLYERKEPQFQERGWRESGIGKCNIENGRLTVIASELYRLTVIEEFEEIEFACNLRVKELAGPDAAVRLFLEGRDKDLEAFSFVADNRLASDLFRQFRLVRQNDNIYFYMDGECIDAMNNFSGTGHVGMEFSNVTVEIEMTRLTQL